MKVQDLAFTSIETISAFDISSGAFKFLLDELQSVTIAQGQEKTDIVGKQGRKITSLKRNKTVTISGDNGIVSGGLLEMQTGSGFTSKNATVRWVDYLTVDDSHEATTSYKAIGTAGSEISALYIKNSDGTIDDTLEQAASAAAGKFAYAPATKKLSFHTDVAEGTEIVVFYDRTIAASVQENASDKYSGKAEIFIDAIAEDKCANQYHVQIHIPKGDFNGEFSFEIGDNQTVQSFEIEALSGGCGAGNSSKYWDYIIFGADAADVTE